MSSRALVTHLAIVTILGIVAFGCPAKAEGPLERLQVYSSARPVPDIAFKGSQGEGLTLASFRGRFVILNVWATWCVPCRKEMPTLDQLQGRFNDDDVTVIALSIDRKGLAVIDKFFRDTGVERLTPYVDTSGKVLRALGFVGLPGTLLIDREGREVGRVVGEADWSSQAIIDFIEAKSGASARP